MLKPSKDKFINVVLDEETKWGGGYGDRIIYQNCIECIRKIDFCKIKLQDVCGPIKVFLLNWGKMDRVTRYWGTQGRLKRRSPTQTQWEEDLTYAIKDCCNELTRVRNEDLEKVNLENFEQEVKTCYDRISSVVKYTGASKVLHLLCPNFFPMWDVAIRTSVNKEYNKSINNKSKGYFVFMEATQEFLRNYSDVIVNLSKRLKKPKLRVLDEYWWVVARE